VEDYVRRGVAGSSCRAVQNGKTMLVLL